MTRSSTTKAQRVARAIEADPEGFIDWYRARFSHHDGTDQAAHLVVKSRAPFLTHLEFGFARDPATGRVIRHVQSLTPLRRTIRRSGPTNKSVSTTAN